MTAGIAVMGRTMAGIGPLSSSGSASSALQLLSDVLATRHMPVLSKTSTPTVSTLSSSRLSPGTSDAVLKIMDLISQQNAARVQPKQTFKAEPATVSSQLPADKVNWLKSLGADAWVVNEPPQIRDEEFQKQVLDSMLKSGSAKLTGFSEALENGSLKIQRASEVPEMGYKSYNVTLYKGGQQFGSAGFDTANTNYLMELRKSGTFAALGTINGNDYVVTWAMPWEADNFLLRTGIYAATENS